MLIRFLILLVVLLLRTYINSLMLVASLLVLVLLLLSWIVLNNLLRGLLCLIIITVYLGAIIILISYVCAVCPNLCIKQSKAFFSLLTHPAFLSCLLRRASTRSFFLVRETHICLLFTPLAYKVLLLLLIYIFVILLSVTTQFTFPQGPFRSI